MQKRAGGLGMSVGSRGRQGAGEYAWQYFLRSRRTATGLDRRECQNG